MNYKSRQAALAALRQYGGLGVTFQYRSSGRWNWASRGAPLWVDIVNTLCETGEAILNPKAAPLYRVGVQNVKFCGG